MKLGLLRGTAGLFFLFSAAACDLNHNWVTGWVETEKSIPAFAWGLLARDAFSEKWPQAMILDIDDLHKKKGVLRETDSQILERSPEEVQSFVASLMQANVPGVKFYSQEKHGFSSQDFYQAENLQYLAQAENIDYFIKIKLRNYGTMHRHQYDSYPRNKGVFQDEKQYSIDFAYAVLDTQGMYVDFKDYKSFMTELWVYRMSEEGVRTDISSSAYEEKTGTVVNVQHFLGLEKIEEFGKSLVSFLGY